MSTHRRLTDRVADSVLRGDAGRLRASGRPDLAAVAEALAPLRCAAQEGPPPSPALARLLEQGFQGLPADKGDLPVTAARRARGSAAQTARPPKGRNRVITEWLGGLGLAAKIGLATTVAAASVGVSGAAGVLPTSAQDTFDQVVSSVTPLEVDHKAKKHKADTGITVEEPSAVPTDDDNDATPDPSASDAATDDASPSTDASDEATEDATKDDGDNDGDGADDQDGDHRGSGSSGGSSRRGHGSGQSGDGEESHSGRGSGGGEDGDGQESQHSGGSGSHEDAGDSEDSGDHENADDRGSDGGSHEDAGDDSGDGGSHGGGGEDGGDGQDGGDD